MTEEERIQLKLKMDDIIIELKHSINELKEVSKPQGLR
jgi:hypothetical protein